MGLSTPRMVRPSPTQSRCWFALRFTALLLTSLAALTLLSVALDLQPFGPQDDAVPAEEDERANSCGVMARAAGKLTGTPLPFALPRRAFRGHLARSLRFLDGSGRSGNSGKPIATPLVSAPVHSFPPLSGCEHAQRNGLGAPLRC